MAVLPNGLNLYMCHKQCFVLVYFPFTSAPLPIIEHTHTNHGVVMAYNDGV